MISRVIIQEPTSLSSVSSGVSAARPPKSRSRLPEEYPRLFRKTNCISGCTSILGTHTATACYQSSDRLEARRPFVPVLQTSSSHPQYIGAKAGVRSLLPSKNPLSGIGVRLFLANSSKFQAVAGAAATASSRSETAGTVGSSIRAPAVSRATRVVLASAVRSQTSVH